jgi:hypothetical protein
MLRSVLLIAALAGPLSAQRVLLTPIAGVSVPLSGEMVMWEPIPTMSGFDSIPVKHRYTSGFTVGLLAEWNRMRAFGIAAQASATFATREIEDPNTPECGDCGSAIYAVGVMAMANRPLASGARLHIGVGPELLLVTGGAVSNAGHAPPPTAVEIDPRSVIGGLASVGISRPLASGSELRVTLGYRRFAPTHKGVDDGPSPDPSVNEDTFSELLLTVGFRPRRR